MRKYQQLLLIVIAILSFTILCVYKFENNRLKDVLDVVNFFGRNDADILIENKNSTYFALQSNFEDPLPLWQHIGNNFYAYSAFFQKNILSPGGSVVAIAVGLKNNAVNFKCDIKFPDNTVEKGKFRFIRMDTMSAAMPTIANEEDYSVYKFICKFSREIGAPQNIIFSNIKSKLISHKLPIRHNKPDNERPKMFLTVCLDLNEYDDNKNVNSNFVNTTSLLQYFLHYKIIGVDEFIVYSTNFIDHNIKNLLIKHSIKFNVLPYNFPYSILDREKNYRIIEMDCILRNINLSKYVILTKLNNYLYPHDKLISRSNVLLANNPDLMNVNRYEITQKTICIDQRKKIFSDNLFYKVNTTDSHKFYIYKIENNENEYVKSIKIHENKMLLHNYIYCNNENNKTGLTDWPTTPLNIDIKNNIRHIGQEILKSLNN